VRQDGVSWWVAVNLLGEFKCPIAGLVQQTHLTGDYLGMPWQDSVPIPRG
jgi:hypothetical protein